MPKCLTASRVFFLPLKRTVLEPVGARSASWSRVNTSPPALRMRSLAARVKRKAAIDNLGTSVRRTSSVTVDTVTIILESRSGALAVSLVILESEIGGLLTLDRKSRWRITLLKLESVRRAKKR